MKRFSEIELVGELANLLVTNKLGSKRANDQQVRFKTLGLIVAPESPEPSNLRGCPRTNKLGSTAPGDQQVRFKTSRGTNNITNNFDALLLLLLCCRMPLRGLASAMPSQGKGGRGDSVGTRRPEAGSVPPTPGLAAGLRMIRAPPRSGVLGGPLRSAFVRRLARKFAHLRTIASETGIPRTGRGKPFGSTAPIPTTTTRNNEMDTQIYQILALVLGTGWLLSWWAHGITRANFTAQLDLLQCIENETQQFRDNDLNPALGYSTPLSARLSLWYQFSHLDADEFGPDYPLGWSASAILRDGKVVAVAGKDTAKDALVGLVEQIDALPALDRRALNRASWGTNPISEHERYVTNLDPGRNDPPRANIPPKAYDVPEGEQVRFEGIE